MAVEAVTAAQTGSTVSVPAHIEFRDGAVSQVGAPLDGRIIRVHVLVGQKVHAGDPLLTLDCPDATGSRAAAQWRDASLREARIELERQRRMQQEGVGIERDVVAAETKVSAAEAEVRARKRGRLDRLGHRWLGGRACTDRRRRHQPQGERRNGGPSAEANRSSRLATLTHLRGCRRVRARSARHSARGQR